jgi:hypothetical protein
VENEKIATKNIKNHEKREGARLSLVPRVGNG